MILDDLDKKAALAFDGYLVRKDLVRQFKGQFPVPTYVVEFLLGRYCASIDDEEIEEGLQIVQRQLSERSVRAGEEELFKARAQQKGSVKLLDIITARLDAKNDCYFATLPSLRLTDVRISAAIVSQHERMLTGGFYAEVSLNYDPFIAQENGGHPFGIESIRPIQLSSLDILNRMSEARNAFSSDEWKELLLRSIGFEPSALNGRAGDAVLLRLVPFVENNFNLVELGPRGTGKSHLYQQISPYAHLVSGGKATVARMFVNNASGQRGLVCQYDVVCFDEVSGISFDQKDGVNIMKGYMESGMFSRGKESIRGYGSIVMVGNFDVDVEHQQRVSHLFGPMPAEMRNDTAFMDRIHAYMPGWDVPKVGPSLYTDHFGLVSDFLSECFNQLRKESRVQSFKDRIRYGGALSGRDIHAVNKTVSGLLKLMYPSANAAIPDDDIEWAVRIAMECRRRVKEQQKRIGAAEYRSTHFSYTLGDEGVEKFVSTPELHSESSIQPEPMEPGQIWTINPGSNDENQGLYRIEINEGPGSGVKILNRPAPQSFKEAVDIAHQNLCARAIQYLGDRDPRSHEYSIQLRSFDTANTGRGLGVAVLIAMCSTLMKKPVKGGLVVTGTLNLGGSIEPVYNAVSVIELAIEKGAQIILIPVNCRRQLVDLSDDMATKANIVFYSDAGDALNKALME
ncbi:MAG TPA: protease Lon-related BREX system protein BrxL [Chitinispirillaceae bacterium]|nr:protease Lon-related BREX system protein BrxL [Chitinispirillaceae bacterium]